MSPPSNDDKLNRWDRPAAILLFGIPACVLVAATFAPRGATRIYTWPWAFYVQAALLAVWLGCAWRFARGHTGLRDGRWVVSPLLAALGISVATSSHWHDALEAALVLATPLLLLPFAAQAWARQTADHKLLGMRIVGGIMVALAITSLALWLPAAPEHGWLRWFFASRNPHPLGHWNYNGGLALLALPVVVWLASATRGPERLAWIAGAAAVFVQLLSAGSRGAVLGLFGAAATVGFALATRRRWSARALVAVTAISVGVVAAMFLANPRFRQIAAEPASLFVAGESEQQRLGFILTGLRIAKAHPWTGIGPGTTPYHYPAHRVDLQGSLENSFQLHCGPVQWMVDTGLTGLCALVLVGGLLARRAWLARKSMPPVAIAAAAALVGYGVLWLTDYQLDAPIYPVLLSLAAAVFLAETTAEVVLDTAPAGSRARAIATAAMALAAVLGAAVLIPSWRARSAFSAGWTAKDQGDAHAFVQHLRTAASFAPWQPYYQNHLARALAGIAAHLPPETASALRSDARMAWENSSNVAPHQDHPWLNLAWLALAENRPEAAEQLFEYAASIQPRRRGLWFGIALTRLSLGRQDEACIALAREIRLDPGFIMSPLWGEEPFASLRPKLLALLGEGWPPGDELSQAAPRNEMASSSFQDPGAPPASAFLAFAIWWWNGEIIPVDSSQAELVPAFNLLAVIPVLDDRLAPAPTDLPPVLVALRGIWLTGDSVNPVAPGILPPQIAALWKTHVQDHRADRFTTLLRTFAAPTIRRIQRGADGILFRQTDGDPLTDLTEIPTHALADLFAPIMPRPAVTEFFADPTAAPSPRTNLNHP